MTVSWKKINSKEFNKHSRSFQIRTKTITIQTQLNVTIRQEQKIKSKNLTSAFWLIELDLSDATRFSHFTHSIVQRKRRRIRRSIGRWPMTASDLSWSLRFLIATWFWSWHQLFAVFNIQCHSVLYQINQFNIIITQRPFNVLNRINILLSVDVISRIASTNIWTRVKLRFAEKRIDLISVLIFLVYHYLLWSQRAFVKLSYQQLKLSRAKI